MTSGWLRSGHVLGETAQANCTGFERDDDLDGFMRQVPYEGPATSAAQSVVRYDVCDRLYLFSVKPSLPTHSITRLRRLGRGYTMARLCYAAQDRPASARAVADVTLVATITDTFITCRRRYGAPQVHRALRLAGHRVGRKRVARLMRAAGPQARRRRRQHGLGERYDLYPDGGISRS